MAPAEPRNRCTHQWYNPEEEEKGGTKPFEAYGRTPSQLKDRSRNLLFDGSPFGNGCGVGWITRSGSGHQYIRRYSKPESPEWTRAPV
ncbi:uncharacterized protein V6R79_011630 [Siganus canaliculatus]